MQLDTFIMGARPLSMTRLKKKVLDNKELNLKGVNP